MVQLQIHLLVPAVAQLTQIVGKHQQVSCARASNVQQSNAFFAELSVLDFLEQVVLRRV